MSEQLQETLARETEQRVPQERPDSDPILVARLARDEARLAADEERMSADEQSAHATRVVSLTGLAVAGGLVIAVAALVLAIVALRQDVTAIQNEAPAGSVGTAAIRDSTITADKLAVGAIGAKALRPAAVKSRAIASGAVGGAELASGAVRGADVGHDALTGADIRESTLARVPSAARSGTARTSDNARALGGTQAGAYVAHVKTIRQSTELSRRAIKGPLTAPCPRGARVLSGGAVVEGAVRGISIVASGPSRDGWTAVARRTGSYANPWRLVVTVICATRR